MQKKKITERYTLTETGEYICLKYNLIQEGAKYGIEILKESGGAPCTAEQTKLWFTYEEAISLLLELADGVTTPTGLCDIAEDRVCQLGIASKR